jgi:AcrR family transcriptional regulator
VTERALPPVASLVAEGLRERKKAMMRRLISDTATKMFLGRGFDEVKVIEVAEACGVSEKTVYNYFPTKESLLLDREQDMIAAIQKAFGPSSPARSPIEAALGVLALDFEEVPPKVLPKRRGPEVTDVRRFAELIQETPALRAAQGEMLARLTAVVAEALADRAGVSPDEPEPQIAAHAILGLWRVQHQAVRRYADDSDSYEEFRDRVTADVRRAATLLEAGLWSFGAMLKGGNSREQLKAAAEAAQRAGRQVSTAIRHAKAVWLQLQEDAERYAHHGPGDEHHGRGRQRSLGGDRPRPQGRGRTTRAGPPW